ncbi:hypothetical protein NC651_024302 [Populus alba x Populus x berolinensis]|nr:hypothetical protein NC651_024302 [Populus alba x Populus x berolinensis]
MFRGVQILRNKSSSARIQHIFQCSYEAKQVGQVEYFRFNLFCFGYD